MCTTTRIEAMGRLHYVQSAAAVPREGHDPIRLRANVRARGSRLFKIFFGHRFMFVWLGAIDTRIPNETDPPNCCPGPVPR